MTRLPSGTKRDPISARLTRSSGSSARCGHKKLRKYISFLLSRLAQKTAAVCTACTASLDAERDLAMHLICFLLGAGHDPVIFDPIVAMVRFLLHLL